MALLPAPAQAQNRAAAPEALSLLQSAGPARLEPGRAGTGLIVAPSPRWVRWGLIGAGAGAVAFAVLGRMTLDSEPNPMLQDAALGAVSGFVILGGSIALYDAVCSPGSRSRSIGLC